MSQVHGGRLVAQGLKRHGIDTVFTLCGTHVQAIYDGCLDENIRVVDSRHEQTATFAADAYSRLFGSPGVAVVSAGAGVTNCTTAMANAYRAGIPLVCIGGAPPQALSDRGASKSIDSIALMRTVTKWATSVPETQRIKEYVDSAFRIAQGGCPGPVYLELPLDRLMTVADDAAPLTHPAPPARPAPSPESLKSVARLVERAERPIFIVGSQLRWSPQQDAVQRLATRLKVPVFLNGLAKGALPSGHPCLLSRCRRLAMGKADLIVLVGTPLDFRLNYGNSETCNSEAKLIQVDLDSEVLGQNRALEQSVQSDAGIFLAQLAEHCEKPNSEAWLAYLGENEAKSVAAQRQSVPCSFASQVYSELASRLGESDILIADGGGFVAAAVKAIPLSREQMWLDPGPFGAMGLGPGFAMAANVYRPEARAIIVSGDGAFGLSTAEYEALVRQGFKVISVIGNNARWEHVQRGQAQCYGAERLVATDLSYGRYDQAVAALGGQGYWVESAEDMKSAFDGAFASSVPACINVKLPA